MNIKEINAGDPFDAHVKWKEYIKLAKANPKDKSLADLREVYRQAKNSRKMFHLPTVIKQAGTRYSTEEEKSGYSGTVPKFAICQARSKYVICDYRMNGHVAYNNDHYSRWCAIELPDCLPTYTWQDKATYRSKQIKAPVPKIPAGVWNGKLRDDYFILWEVDKWEINYASLDPFLLKRVTKNIFVVLAHWELTPLEQLVMSEYL